MVSYIVLELFLSHKNNTNHLKFYIVKNTAPGLTFNNLKVLDMGSSGFSKGDLYNTFTPSFQLKRSSVIKVTFSVGKVL